MRCTLLFLTSREKRRTGMLFQDLYNWILALAIGAIFLLLAGGIFTYHMLSRRSTWWQYFLPIVALLVNIWSIVIINNMFHLIQYVYTNIPAHGSTIYERNMKATPFYQQGVFTCQVQMVVLFLVFILVLAGERWQLTQHKTPPLALPTIVKADG